MTSKGEGNGTLPAIGVWPALESPQAAAMTTQQMTVGELSRRTGVPIKRLRQYTDWGLIYTVGRSRTGYRLFDADALWCVQTIGQLRGLGLTLAEIRDLTAAYLDRSESFGPLLAERLHASRQRVMDRIEELRATLRRIDDFENTHGAERGRHAGMCFADDPRCRESA